MALSATLYPNRTGDSTAWTPSVAGGANWAMVADQSGVTTVSTQTVNAVDLYYLTAMPIDAYIMSASLLHPNFRFEFLAAGGSQISAVYKRGGVTVVDTAINGNGAWQAITANPARPSGGSWGVGDYSGLQVGYKAIAVAGGDTIYVRKVNEFVSYWDRTHGNVDTHIGPVNSSTFPVRDPVPMTVNLTMTAAEAASIDADGGTAGAAKCFGPFTVPGQKQPIYVTLSRESLVNLGTGL